MGTLFIVGTPIGNLEDITPRSARVLGQVDLIAAEDTRVTRRLLAHLGIKARLISYHEHNWRTRLPQVLEALETGDVGLVCDAGMPTLRDPGSELVSRAAAAGFPVEVVPGPSALTAALAVSGFSADAFIFLGFLPRRRKDRRERLRAAAPLGLTLVLFEAPHRVSALLEDLLAELGDRPVALCRELTKLHEEVFRGTVSEAMAHAPRGEYVILVEAGAPDGANGPGTGAKSPAEADEARVDEARCLLAGLRRSGTTAKDAVAAVAGSLGMPKNLVYRLWVEAGARRQD